MSKKISGFSELSSVADGDLLEIVDVSDTTDAATGTNKKVQISNLISDASTTVKGKVELATTSETETGTDTTRAVTPDGLHDMTTLAGAAWLKDEDNMVSDSAVTVPSQQSVKAYVDRELYTTLNIHPLYAPQGFLINGKISVTDAGGITVALKTLAGTDPSATDPVYCRIGDTVRTITSALSKALPDGVNYMKAGSAELATKEIDYFIHIGWNASAGTPFIGWARIPCTSIADIASYNTIDEKSLMCSQTNADGLVNGDYMEVVGRFAATLSAGAGYTWSVPTYTAANLINRPIYESRWLDILPAIAVSGGTVPTYSSSVYKYRVVYDRVHYTLNLRNTSGGTAGSGTNPITFQLPFDPSATASDDSGGLGMGSCYENGGTICGIYIGRNAANKAYARNITSVASIVGNDQSDANRIFQAQGVFQF